MRLYHATDHINVIMANITNVMSPMNGLMQDYFILIGGRMDPIRLGYVEPIVVDRRVRGGSVESTLPST